MVIQSINRRNGERKQIVHSKIIHHSIREMLHYRTVQYLEDRRAALL